MEQTEIAEFALKLNIQPEGNVDLIWLFLWVQAVLCLFKLWVLDLLKK